MVHIVYPLRQSDPLVVIIILCLVVCVVNTHSLQVCLSMCSAGCGQITLSRQSGIKYQSSKN
jgi:hypothetical protein